MGSIAIPCHGCRAPIPPIDVERRRVVIVLKRPYCERCSGQITTRRTVRKKRNILIIAALVILCLAALAASL